MIRCGAKRNLRFLICCVKMKTGEKKIIKKLAELKKKTNWEKQVSSEALEHR